jgi:hypothetical protein
MKLQRSILVVALLAGSLVAALAAKLDKTACNELSSELAGIVAEGARDDMGRGPDWARSNLSQERLSSIRRLLEVEQQLEFRCGMGRGKALAVKPGKPPAKSADENNKAKRPHAPAKTDKTNQSGEETNSTRMAAAPTVAPVTNAPARVAEKSNAAPPLPKAPSVVATAPVVTAARSEPPAAAPPVQTPVQMETHKLNRAPVAVPQAKTARRFNAAKLAVIAALPPQSLPQPGEAEISLDLKAAGLSTLRPRVTGPRRKAAPRRETTYVSPRDVNPYFMSRYGTSR